MDYPEAALQKANIKGCKDKGYKINSQTKQICVVLTIADDGINRLRLMGQSQSS